MRIDWRTALVYVTREPSWTRRIAVGGLMLLVLPPIGWLLALGYRSLVGNRLVDRQAPLLPEWRGNFLISFRRGAASLGVTLVYLTPFLIAYWMLGVRTPDAAAAHWREIAKFIGGVILFPPAALPTLPVLYAVWYDWLHFTVAEMSLLIILFVGAILLLPAAFLQVAQHRRFLAALDVVSAVRLVARVPRLYAEAWFVSLAVSAVAVLVVPLAPWLLFWSYLIISHLFLQALAACAEPRRTSRAPRWQEATSP